MNQILTVPKKEKFLKSIFRKKFIFKKSFRKKMIFWDTTLF